MKTGLHLQFDVCCFAQEMVQAGSGAIELSDAITRIEHETDATKQEISRDPHVRFQQIRYLNSLSRLHEFLSTHVLPKDLTPRERLAIRALGTGLRRAVPDALAFALEKVTLPAGVFGESFDIRHRLAS